MNQMVHDQINQGPATESQAEMIKRYRRQLAEENTAEFAERETP